MSASKTVVAQPTNETIEALLADRRAAEARINEANEALASVLGQTSKAAKDKRNHWISVKACAVAALKKNRTDLYLEGHVVAAYQPVVVGVKTRHTGQTKAQIEARIADLTTKAKDCPFEDIKADLQRRIEALQKQLAKAAA